MSRKSKLFLLLLATTAPLPALAQQAQTEAAQPAGDGQYDLMDEMDS